MQYLRQSTAFTFRAGPFLDKTDGATFETALTIAQADIQISKNGGAFGQTSGVTPTTTYDSMGHYQCPITGTDTATAGPMRVVIAKTVDALPVFHDFMVIPGNVYDSLVSGSDLLDVNGSQLAGQTITAAAGVTFPTSVASPTNITAATGVVLSGVTHTGAVIPTVTTLTNLPAITASWLTAAGIATDAFTAAKFAADFLTEMQAGLATLAAQTAQSTKLDNLLSGIIFGAATTGTLTATSCSTNLTGYTADQLIGRVIIWLTGNADGEASNITDYVVTNGVLTFTALTVAPANTDTFKIV